METILSEPASLHLLETMPVGLIRVDTDDRILSVNHCAEEITGKSRQALIGMSCSNILPDIKNLLEKKTSRQDSSLREEIMLMGQIYQAVLMSGKETSIFLVPMVSVMPHHNLSMGSLTSVLAHEIKNPLSGIRGAAQLLESKLSDKDQKLAQLIKSESDRIVSLIDSYDAFGTEEKAEAVNINQILDYCLQVSSHGFARDKVVTTSFDPSLPELTVRKNQLIQAILNLLKNACEAGNRIYLRSLYAWGPVRAENGQRVRMGLAIEVEDDGDGMAPSVAEKMFEPFVTTKRGYRGMGLAQVNAAAVNHRGLIEFHLNPTVFRLTLPIELMGRK